MKSVLYTMIVFMVMGMIAGGYVYSKSELHGSATFTYTFGKHQETVIDDPYELGTPKQVKINNRHQHIKTDLDDLVDMVNQPHPKDQDVDLLDAMSKS
jgi:hypothetical protein